MKVENVVIGLQFEENENLEKLLEIVNDKKINLSLVEEGNQINIENNLYFDVLWPSSSQAVSENAINNNALVMKLNYAGNFKALSIKEYIEEKNYSMSMDSSFSMLFTGDIEAETEAILVQKYSNTNILNSTILKVGHHGSNSSSTKEFLNAVNPKIALIGVGENNKYGHPGEEVLERLEKAHIKIFRTDEDGEISINIKDNFVK
jgi:competence protein ComEC